MYVAVTGRGRARVIQFCEQQRIPGTKKKKTFVLRTLGNYEEMLKENPNIIEELKIEARKLTLEKKEREKKRGKGERLNQEGLFRFGHALIQEVWKQVKLPLFFCQELGEEEGEKMSQILFQLVVYRLGSSYKNFNTNRKIPFLHLDSVSEEDFYFVLERLYQLKDKLQSHIQAFFSKKRKLEKEHIYAHLSHYSYNDYWKCIQKKSHKHLQEDDFCFSMLLLFDKFGLPLEHTLFVEEKEARALIEKWEEKKEIREIISLSPDFLREEGAAFLYSKKREDLTEEIQKKILEEHSWYITEKDAKTEETLQAELNFPYQGREKYFVLWSKKRALRDYLQQNNQKGYFCLHSNLMELQGKEMLRAFEHIRKIEEKFSMTNVPFDKTQLRGHFELCYLSLCIIRYFQYLLGSEGKVLVPMIYANKAISNPMIFQEHSYGRQILSPLHVTNSYLKLAKALGLPSLEESMLEQEFTRCTGLKV